MAFEQVYLRTAQGQQYGPVEYQELLRWHQEGRVPPDAFLVDTITGEAQPVRNFPALAIAPPPMPGAPGMPMPMQQRPPSGINQMIPTQNPMALWAYYCSIFGLLCCAILGPVSLILGILGLRDSDRTGVGKGHAITGIVLGGIETLVGIGGIVAAIISGASGSSY